MKFLGVLCFYVLSTMYSGWVLSVMWSWFVVTTFNAPILTIPAAIGISSIVSYLTVKITPEDIKDDAIKLSRVTFFVRPTVVLGLGFIVSQFM